MAQSMSHQQHLLRDSWLNAAPILPTTSRQPRSSSLDRRSESGRETIHSGHFMVSHFEAEAQDDEDTEIAMPDPDESGALAELNTCTDVVLAGHSGQHSQVLVSTSTRSNSSAVIDISLAKLFKCMNLAYRQKLTSPKWNRFKGIRLRWKDKIRLNNLIWRCWHMQFIMKKRTPVCQFASPLDVDLHSKPESVVLEGKYWKRQFDVIKAEYMKWRKFYRNRGLGNNAILDTVSEIDIFDWSPITNDKNLMSIDDYYWTADTLFSTINQPFPFPDAREIARAGIADFIQPSLGPLQPNLDDFMNGAPLQELINNHLSSRLPSVPEEGTDDAMFGRNDAYDFPAIMDSEPIDSALLTDVTNTAQSMSNQLICGTSTGVLQQNMLSYDSTSNATLLQYPNKMYDTQTSNMSSMTMNRNAMDMQQTQMTQQNQMLSQNTNFLPSVSDASTLQATNTDMLSNLSGAKKRQQMARNSRFQFGRRDPPNYDKTAPTQHQTALYNQIMAQQNSNKMQQQQQISNSLPTVISNTPIYNNINQRYQTTDINSLGTNIMDTQTLQMPPIQTTTNTYMNALNLSASNDFPMTSNHLNSTLMNIITNTSPQQLINTAQQQTMPPPQTTTVKSSNLLSLLSMKTPVNSSDDIQPMVIPTTHTTSNYKSYSMQSPMKATTYNPMQQQSATMSTPLGHQINSMNDRQQQINTNLTAIDKEMFRSKSLPMNSTLQLPVMREEFAVPKYQAQKSSSNRIRARSNSMVSKQHHHTHSPSMQPATSEPMLKTLAQLLTSTSTPGSSSVSNLQQSEVLANANLVSPAELPQKHQKHQSHTTSQSQPSTSWISQVSQRRPTNSRVEFAVDKSEFTTDPSGREQSTFNSFVTPSLSPDHKFTSPGASTSSALSPGLSSGDSMQRRAGHIHAEQKRRYNIKNGFDMLHALIPQLQQNPNAKISKASMLDKGAMYIKQLRAERDATNQKMEVLRKERDALNNSLLQLHSILPANGAPVSRQRTSRVKELYHDYVRERTLQNWKFWILGFIFEPLLSSFNSTVSVASMEELYRSAMIWVDNHCSLIEIRPAVSDKLRYLSTSTDILSDPPSTLQEEVMKALSKNNSPNLL